MRLLLKLSLSAILMLNALLVSSQCLESASFNTTQTAHTVYFTPSFSLQEGEVLLSFAWNLGDGNFSSIESPVHTYDNPNDYEVCLTITTAFGGEICSFEVCETIAILEALPCNVTAAFEWVDAGMGEVLLQEFCETNIFTEVTSFFWEGSEGQLVEGALSELTFESLSEPEVCLTVQAASQGNTCSATICKSVELEIPSFNLSPNFTVKANDGCEMRFINTTDELGIQNIQFSWTIDGSEIPYSNQPLHQFTEDGTHSVCLNAEAQWYGEVRIETYCQEIQSNCSSDENVAEGFVAVAFQQDRKPIQVNGTSIRMNSLDGIDHEEPLNFTVYNLQGQTVFTGVFSRTQSVNLNTIGKGMFVVHIHGNNEDLIQKVLLP
jgi:PKD repeat protein